MGSEIWRRNSVNSHQFHFSVFHFTDARKRGTNSGKPNSVLEKWMKDEPRSTQLNSTQLNSTQLNSTQLNSTQLNSTQLNSTQLNSTQLNSTQLARLNSYHRVPFHDQTWTAMRENIFWKKSLLTAGLTYPQTSLPHLRRKTVMRSISQPHHLHRKSRISGLDGVQQVPGL